MMETNSFSAVGISLGSGFSAVLPAIAAPEKASNRDKSNARMPVLLMVD
jgi:hypothetical protein